MQISKRINMAVLEGLLVGLGYAITGPDSSFLFHQALSAAERSGVSGIHQWSVMLPTSARDSQEIYEPLIIRHTISYAAQPPPGTVAHWNNINSG